MTKWQWSIIVALIDVVMFLVNRLPEKEYELYWQKLADENNLLVEATNRTERSEVRDA